MVDYNLMPTQSIKFTFLHTFALVFSFLLFLSIRSTIHRHNSLSCCGSCFSSIQTSLGQSRGPSSKPSGAPDCHQSRQNRTIGFAKSDTPVSVVSSRSFRILFISCDNTFWRLRWGIDYFKHIKHEGWKLRQ
jgi:hypothetical protein